MKIIICGVDQNRTKQGVHSRAPDLHYFEDALQSAERDLFPAVYLHYDTVGTAQYSIPYDVLERLTQLAGEYEVSFIHPCATAHMLKEA